MATRKRSPRWFLVSIANFLVLAGLWLLACFASEDFWLVALITFVPQQIFVLPTVALALFAAAQKNWRVLSLQLPAFALLLFGFLGFNVPWPRLPARSAPCNHTLRVVTYNIRSGSLGTAEIGRELKRADADVICLQEATGLDGVPDPVPTLKSALFSYDVAQYSEFTIFSRFPIVAQHNHPLSTYEGFGALETRIDVQGRKLAVFNVHVTNLQKGPPFALSDAIRKPSNVRREQVELVSTLAEKCAVPIVIAGDFNLPPRGHLYRRLAEGHHDAFRSNNFGFGYTYPAAFPLMRIDYIWSGNGAKPISSRVLSTRASDHRPLVAEILLPPRSPATQDAG